MLTATMETLDQDARYRLSGLARTASEGDRLLELTTESAHTLLAMTSQPSPLEQADLVLAYLTKRSTPPGTSVSIDPENDYPVAHAQGAQGLWFLLKDLVAEGLIERTAVRADDRDKSALPHFRVTMQGYKRLADLGAASARARAATSSVGHDQSQHDRPPETSLATVASPGTSSQGALTSQPTLSQPPAPVVATSGGESLPRMTPGSSIGHYEIIGELGRGGMGVVYKAQDTRLDDLVALKTLSEQSLQDPKLRARFRSEIKLARKVTHPHVCRIYEFGEHDGLVYYTMELIEGPTLKELIRQGGPLQVAEAIDVAVQITEGLCALHDRGIIHRDLKSSNVMRDDRGLVRLLDFGLAKDVSTDTTRTVSDAIRGSLEYMSLEQLRNETVDARSDLYSFGILLYELLVGHTPFRGQPAQILLHHLQSPPPLYDQEAAIIPEGLKLVIAKCLAKAPGDRYGSAREIVVILQGLKAAPLKVEGDARSVATPDQPAQPVTSAMQVALRRRLRDNLLLVLYHAKAFNHHDVAVHEFAKAEALKLGTTPEEGTEAFEHLVQQRWATYTTMGPHGMLTADGVERAERMLLKQ